MHTYGSLNVTCSSRWWFSYLFASTARADQIASCTSTIECKTVTWCQISFFEKHDRCWQFQALFFYFSCILWYIILYSLTIFRPLKAINEINIFWNDVVYLSQLVHFAILQKVRAVLSVKTWRKPQKRMPKPTLVILRFVCSKSL